MNGNKLNPTAISYAPGSQPKSHIASQVSVPPSPYLEARILNLEEGHVELREEFEDLAEKYRGLCSSVDKLKRGGWDVSVGPFQEKHLAESHRHAMRLKQELEQLTHEVHKSVNRHADVEKANGTVTAKKSSITPPHMRVATPSSDGTVKKTVPPHMRGKMAVSACDSPSNPLVTDGPVDTVSRAQVPAPTLSPPLSPATVMQQDVATSAAAQPDIPVHGLDMAPWKPHFVSTLAPCPSTTRIPSTDKMVTFHPAFLDQHLGGTEWSPGLRFITGEFPCILKDRTYYMLSPAIDPYLPEKPSQHGAKLTAFFNESPEDNLTNLPADLCSYKDVPMFVEVKDSQGHTRYAYYGNYSQTRWSDKLDYDTMMARVPQHIKEYWSVELTSAARPAWMTQALKDHFFKKPEYTGRVFAAVEADTTTVTSEEEVKLNDKMARDIRKYVEELRDWEREANMKTAMIKKQFILDAFDAADADEPPALRLWWEYLECVEWRRDFYDLLVTLQSRKADQYLK
ncbi:hypothetical protein BKA63DRAFT_428394 [Paraphoma chrysanthemicola]|nr:hypothetical protein BKA63DRAFT_428394 [Paraphoma chrysanthemicola]